MRIAVIYESYFGNTEQAAEAIGEVLKRFGETEVKRAAVVRPDQLKGWDLIVFGSPTRKFTAAPSVKTLIRRMPRGSLTGVRTAVFDTRIDVSKVSSGFLKRLISIFGYGAEKIQTLLASRGAVSVSPPQWFYVSGTQGPLSEGELDHASAWAQTLVSS